jgi:RES domain-containing protein
MVYTAASAGLAVLEVLVHLDLPPELMPDDYQLLGIQIPDHAPIESLDDTPADPAECAAIGDDFLVRAEALALLASSVVVPQERNALINPLHPAMADVAVVSRQPFRFDPRLAGAR